MNIRNLTFTTLALLAVTPAVADFATEIEAVELTPDNIILPGSVNGTMTFKPCVGECEKEHRRARLTADTEFYVDGRKVKFDALRDSMTLLRADEDAYALVSVDLEKQTVTSIRVNE